LLPTKGVQQRGVTVRLGVDLFRSPVSGPMNIWVIFDKVLIRYRGNWQIERGQTESRAYQETYWSLRSAVVNAQGATRRTHQG